MDEFLAVLISVLSFLSLKKAVSLMLKGCESELS